MVLTKVVPVPDIWFANFIKRQVFKMKGEQRGLKAFNSVKGNCK
jgi:hypothetical protein